MAIDIEEKDDNSWDFAGLMLERRVAWLSDLPLAVPRRSPGQRVVPQRLPSGNPAVEIIAGAYLQYINGWLVVWNLAFIFSI
jgi:hypothetical protein